MRVRPQRLTQRRSPTHRRPHLGGRGPGEPGAPPEAQTPADAPEPPAPPADRDLTAARRHRAYVAPQDVAHYSCQCGFQFEASVTTTVACPHCGATQAW